MMSSVLYLFALAAAVASSVSQELLWDQELDNIALLQLRATVLNGKGQSNDSSMLASDDVAGVANLNSSDLAAAAPEKRSNSTEAASTSHATKRSHRDQEGQAHDSMAPGDIVYRLQNFHITPSFWPALTRSFCIVGVAELFDKTWFVALICAVSFGIRNAFFGAFTALLLHTLIAAALGLGISQFLPISVLHFITAAVFAVFACLFSWEWHAADPESDALQSRKEEAKEDLGETGGNGGKHTGFLNLLMWQCFTSVFIAEWGDRTQIAMIALHSSLPVVPVCIGSALAFFVLTLSAVLVAALLEGRNLSERTVCGVSAVSFVIFAFLAVMDGMRARQVEMLA